MLLIRTPPSGLVIKSCLYLYVWHSELKLLTLSFLCLEMVKWRSPPPPPLLTHSEQSVPICLFPILDLGGKGRLFWSYKGIEFDFSLPLLHSVVFSVPFDRNKARRWERNSMCRLPITDTQECQWRYYLFLVGLINMKSGRIQLPF